MTNKSKLYDQCPESKLVINPQEAPCKPFHPTPVVAHHQAHHRAHQVLPVHQAAAQAHHRAAQVHRQAVPAQAGIITLRQWSVFLES